MPPAGSGEGRIYVVEATGPVEDDPNLTDKKFPGNPTLSYRSRDRTARLVPCRGARTRDVNDGTQQRGQ